MFCRSLVLLLGLALLFGVLMVGCSDSDDDTEITKTSAPEPTTTHSPTAATSIPTASETAPVTTEPLSNDVMVIHTSLGDITLELCRDKVPVTVDNFVRLVKDGFYENIIFHRVSDDFMMQAGYLTADGKERASSYGPIDLEIHPDVRHVDGAISMARTNLPNSATSQFFICDGAQSLLDGSYSAFGVVIDGIEVVRQIAAIPHDGSLEPSPGGGKPLEDVAITSIEIVEGD